MRYSEGGASTSLTSHGYMMRMAEVRFEIFLALQVVGKFLSCSFHVVRQ